MEVRGQITVAGSLLPSHGSWRLNPGCSLVLSASTCWAISPTLFWKRLFHIMCVCVLWGYVCVFVFEDMCVWVLLETRSEHWIPWSWSYRWLWSTWYRCWEPNMSPLRGQQVSITTEQSFQPPLLTCGWVKKQFQHLRPWDKRILNWSLSDMVKSCLKKRKKKKNKRKHQMDF